MTTDSRKNKSIEEVFGSVYTKLKSLSLYAIKSEQHEHMTESTVCWWVISAAASFAMLTRFLIFRYGATSFLLTVTQSLWTQHGSPWLLNHTLICQFHRWNDCRMIQQPCNKSFLQEDHDYKARLSEGWQSLAPLSITQCCSTSTLSNTFNKKRSSGTGDLLQSCCSTLHLFDVGVSSPSSNETL